MPASNAPAVRVGFGTPFDEQIEFFRQKLNLPTDRWDDVKRSGHDRAFIVAGAAKADLLQDLRQSVARAIEDGRGIEAFRKDFREIVKKHGWTGWTGEGTKAGEAWRTKVIYQTNMTTSYAAGRYKQLTDPAFLKLRAWWRYVHNDSVMHPRPLHQRWGDMRLTLPYDHPFWKTHFPPNGWGCQCRVVPVDAPGTGDATDPPEGWDAINPKTGAQVGIDKGFDYAPGANARTPLVDLIAQKLVNLEAPVGAAMWESLAPVVAEEQAATFVGFFDQALENRARPQGKWMTVGAFKPKWVEKLQEADIAPATAEMIVRDKDIAHTFRDAKGHQLESGWYRELPRHLLEPQAVILDQTHTDGPALLLIFDAPDATKKLVVRVNYRVKKVGVMNVVETGQTVDVSGIVGSLDNGYTLIDGGL